MAAYAALVSLMHIIDDLHLHPRPPISLHEIQVYLLTKKVTFLQEFLESYNPRLSYSTEANPLETRIADAAHAAEDVIESYIVYQALEKVIEEEEAMEIKLKSPDSSISSSSADLVTGTLTTLLECMEGFIVDQGYSIEQDPLDHAAEDVIETDTVKITSDAALYEALEKVTEEMALIEKDATEMKGHNDQLQRNSMPNLDSSRFSSTIVQRSSMVGADDVLLEMKDKLTDDCRDLRIIPVVGMGGTGKTTLARNIYQDRLIKEHFDICAWATISQEYSIREIFAEVLSHLNDEIVGEDLNEHELGDKLYKHLYGRRYMFVMDDMWSIKAWDGVRRFLPDNENGSRIVVTTRLSNLASELANSNSLAMKLLDEANSWDLLSETVFGKQGCPVELEEIGKKIGKSCYGLPLSIVVVGGLLAKSEHTREFWEYIEKNLSRTVNSKDDEHCLKILHMSYKQLPVYLKPCFLYMGRFPEDDVIRISKLIKLWVAEGFLKLKSGNSLEEIAKEYLKELIDRNLIMIHEFSSIGNIKKCKIHDLLRDLSLREAQKERFYAIVVRTPTPQGIVNAAQRCIIIHSCTLHEDAMDVLSSALRARSLTWNLDEDGILLPRSLRLLRILDSIGRLPNYASSVFPENLHQLINSRFLAISESRHSDSKFPSSIWKFWNLQTLIVVNTKGLTAPTDIWCMPHIRHVQFDNLYLPDPPNSQDDEVVLGNLQTLARIRNFKCSKEVVKRVPNIKKLKILYDKRVDGDIYGLTNLDHLNKLEFLQCRCDEWSHGSLNSRINFPHSLKKLSLSISRRECWEDVLDKIGSLPLLQKLTLNGGRFKEGQWETSEGQFCGLRILAVSCVDFKLWTTESSHFPCLERLLLRGVEELEEIPLDFAEISTLQVIEVYHGSDSVVVSAKRIVEEQEDLYGETSLQVQVKLFWNDGEAMKGLASPNFRVTW